VSILIILNLFFSYTISLFYKKPNFNNYFPQSQVIKKQIMTKKACLKVGGQWVEGPTYNEGYRKSISINSPQMKSYCDSNFTKQQKYNDAQKNYQRNIFVILIILGIVSLGLGVFFTNEIVTLGLTWGGVLSFIIASMRYWSTAGNFIKVLILGLALIVLIWLAVKKFT